jgi:thymidylate synthase
MEANTPNESIIVIARAIRDHGRVIMSRGSETREITGASITVHEPDRMIVTLKERNADLGYLASEMNWYLNGDYTSALAPDARIWREIRNGDGTLNSNYGQIALRDKENGMTQYEWCVTRLTEDLMTRQAVINYNQPRHKYDGNKDYVCALSQQFLYRDGALDTYVNMRSNDLIYGYTYDAAWYRHVQMALARDLNVKPGKYHHTAASMHVYKRHYAMLEAIAEATP